MSGEGVRYGPPSNSESEGWEVVDQDDKATSKVALFGMTSPNRRPLTINPNAEPSSRKPHFPSREGTINAVPSRVVDELLTEQRMLHPYTSKLDEINLYADDNEDSAAWGMDSPSNLLGNDDDLDFEDDQVVESVPRPSTPVQPTWTNNTELSPRSPPPGAFGDDDLDLDDDDDEVQDDAPPTTPKNVPQISSINVHASPFSNTSEPPPGAFGDDDLDLDDDDEILDEDINTPSPEVSHEVLHNVSEVEDATPEIHSFAAPTPVEEQHIPELHSIPLSPHDAPEGAFGDDLDLDLNDDDEVEENPIETVNEIDENGHIDVENEIPLEQVESQEVEATQVFENDPHVRSDEITLAPEESPRYQDVTHEGDCPIESANKIDNVEVENEIPVEQVGTSQGAEDVQDFENPVHYQSDEIPVAPEEIHTAPEVLQSEDQYHAEEFHHAGAANSDEYGHSGFAITHSEVSNSAPEFGEHEEYSLESSQVPHTSHENDFAHGEAYGDVGSHAVPHSEPEFGEYETTNAPTESPEVHPEANTPYLDNEHIQDAYPELHSQETIQHQHADHHSPEEIFAHHDQTIGHATDYENSRSPPISDNFNVNALKDHEVGGAPNYETYPQNTDEIAAADELFASAAPTSFDDQNPEHHFNLQPEVPPVESGVHDVSNFPVHDVAVSNETNASDSPHVVDDGRFGSHEPAPQFEDKQPVNYDQHPHSEADVAFHSAAGSSGPFDHEPVDGPFGSYEPQPLFEHQQPHSEAEDAFHSGVDTSGPFDQEPVGGHFENYAPHSRSEAEVAFHSAADSSGPFDQVSVGGPFGNYEPEPLFGSEHKQPVLLDHYPQSEAEPAFHASADSSGPFDQVPVGGNSSTDHYNHSPYDHEDSFGQSSSAPEYEAHLSSPFDSQPASADSLFGGTSYESGGAFSTPSDFTSAPPQPTYSEIHHQSESASELFSSSTAEFGYPSHSGFDAVPPAASNVDFFNTPSNYQSAPQLSHGDDFFSSAQPTPSQFHSVDHSGGHVDQQLSEGSPFDHAYSDPFHYPPLQQDNGDVFHTENSNFGSSPFDQQIGYGNTHSVPQHEQAGFQNEHSPFESTNDHGSSIYHQHNSHGESHILSNPSPFDQSVEYSSDPFEASSNKLFEAVPNEFHSAPNTFESQKAEAFIDPPPQYHSAPNATSEFFSTPDAKYEEQPPLDGQASSSNVPEFGVNYENPTNSSLEGRSPQYFEVQAEENIPRENSQQKASENHPEKQIEAMPTLHHHETSRAEVEHIGEKSVENLPKAEINAAPVGAPIISKPKIDLPEDDVPTADSLFSPTNGNEISNVFGGGFGNAFDQPPSSLGGFPPSSSFTSNGFERQPSGFQPATESVAYHESSAQSHFQSSPAPQTFSTPTLGQESDQSPGPFEESNGSELFNEPPASDLFGNSGSDPFNQQPTQTHFDQPFVQTNTGYGYENYGSYNQTQELNQANSFGHGYQVAESHDYNRSNSAPYGHQPSYSRAASVASSHFDETASHQSYHGTSDAYGQQAQDHSYQATHYGRSSSTTGVYQQHQATYHQGYGYSQNYHESHHAQPEQTFNHPAYTQPVAQTFDQPAPYPHNQSPGQGFAQPVQSFAAYNQQYGYSESVHSQQGYSLSSYTAQQGYNQPAIAESKPKPTIFKPQAQPTQPASYEQHAPRMSHELKQQYRPSPASRSTPQVFNPAPKLHNETRHQDPSVLPRSCLATFGFGGNLCVMFPRRKLKLLNTAPRNSPRTFNSSSPSFDDHVDESRKGPLDFYKLDQLHHPEDIFYQKLRSFPGPLTAQATDSSILNYMAAQISPSTHEDERLLWEIMQVFLKSKGKVSTRDAQVPDILLAQVIQNSIARRTNLPPIETIQPYVSQNDAQNDANNAKIRQLLLNGDRKGAIEVAMTANMWPQAMLMASYVDPEMYKTVVQSFVSSRYGVGDPLRTLFMVFGDLDVKSLHEPKPLLDANRDQQAPSALIGNWLTQVQILVANPTKDTNRVLVELGDRLLRETNNVWAAHVCYLLSGVALEAPSQTSRMTLIGGQTSGDVRFFVRPNTIQWTEIYEYVMNQTPLVAFQGYKFIYATLLADAGCCDLAFKYVDSMRKLMEQWITKHKMQSPYLDNLKTQLDVFDDRLRFYMGQEKVEAAETQVNKRGLFGTLTGFLDKTLDKIVNDTPPPVKSVTAPSLGAAFVQNNFPAAPSSNSSQPPGSQNSRAPGSQSSAPPGSQPSNSLFNSAPNSNSMQNNVQPALPPRPQPTAPIQNSTPAPAPASAPHPPLKKSSSFTMDTKEKVKDEATDQGPSSEKAKAKTPPTSSQKSGGWFQSLSLPSFGIVDMIRNKADPVGDAKVAKMGKQMEAFYCEERKRWIFPGEEETEEAAPPSAPPTSFPATPAPDSNSAASNSSDPIAALMAPPPLKEATPLAAMMAPPARSMYGSQRGSSSGVKKAPPRPQFAVFKPNPAAVAAPVDNPQDTDAPAPPPTEQ